MRSMSHFRSPRWLLSLPSLPSYSVEHVSFRTLGTASDRRGILHQQYPFHSYRRRTPQSSSWPRPLSGSISKCQCELGREEEICACQKCGIINSPRKASAESSAVASGTHPQIQYQSDLAQETRGICPSGWNGCRTGVFCRRFLLPSHPPAGALISVQGASFGLSSLPPLYLLISVSSNDLMDQTYIKAGTRIRDKMASPLSPSPIFFSGRPDPISIVPPWQCMCHKHLPSEDIGGTLGVRSGPGP